MPSLRTTVRSAAALLILGVAASTAQAFELRGFRGMAWGDGAEGLGPAVQVQAQGEVSCYQRESENLMFGDSVLREVRWCFHRDRLFRVDLGTAADRRGLLAEFQRAYGAPSARAGQGVNWGTQASGTARARLAADASGATLALYSNRFDPALSARAQAPGALQRTALLDR